MIIFKSLKYLCLRICNVDDSRVIDLTSTRSKQIRQSESNKYLNKTRKANNVEQKRRTKQHRTKTTELRKKKRNKCENHLFQ